MRLAVASVGDKYIRTYDKNINRLTVIANESYDDFAKTLQNKIADDCNVSFKDRVKNKNNRKHVTYCKGFSADPEFLEIWNKINKKTSYRVNYDTDELIILAAKALSKIEKIKAPKIRSTKVSIDITDEGIDTQNIGERIHSYDTFMWKIPDVLAYIQNRTELTRATIQQILIKSKRMAGIMINPQLFLDLATKVIKNTLFDIMIEGIKYQQINDSQYEMTLFEAQELEVYLNNYSFENIKQPEKTIYDDFMPLDSETELQFAKDCESNPDVKFYFKMPNWFKIQTPIGQYNPDWAVVIDNDIDQLKLYFVAETKNTGDKEIDLSKLRNTEQLKIKCGVAHYNEFEDIEYKVVKTVGQLQE